MGRFEINKVNRRMNKSTKVEILWGDLRIARNNIYDMIYKSRNPMGRFEGWKGLRMLPIYKSRNPMGRFEQKEITLINIIYKSRNPMGRFESSSVAPSPSDLQK